LVGVTVLWSYTSQLLGHPPSREHFVMATCGPELTMGNLRVGLRREVPGLRWLLVIRSLILTRFLDGSGSFAERTYLVSLAGSAASTNGG
jgi:hypothetical protein